MFEMRKLGGENYKRFKEACSSAINQYKAIMEDLQSGGKGDPKYKGVTAINFNTKKLIEELMLSLDRIKKPEYCLDYSCVVTKTRCNDARTKV